MFAERVSIALTTDASGDCTAYSRAVTGRILAVSYVKTDFDDGVDVTVTTDQTLQAVVALTDINASAVKYPRVQVHGSTGTALTLDGTRTMVEPVVATGERIKVVVAQGGNVKTGTIVLVVG